MNHTSGLTYGFMNTTPVDALVPRSMRSSFKVERNPWQISLGDWQGIPSALSARHAMELFGFHRRVGQTGGSLVGYEFG